jgi:hypothetical protein
MFPFIVSAAFAPLKTAPVTYQYGGASFDPKNTYSQTSHGLTVMEKSDYTIIYWIGYNQQMNKAIYMSVAKKNKWLFRGKEILEVPINNYFGPVNFALANNYVFYRTDDETLRVKILNLENGATLADKLLQKEYSESDMLMFIQSVDRNGVIVGNSQSGYTIYMENELSKPIKLDDPREILMRQFHQNFTPILTAKRDRIVFFNNLYSEVYNIKQKDMIYDETGQEKTFQYGTAYGKKFYAGGKFYAYNSIDNSFQVFDDNFKQLSSLKFKINEKEQYVSAEAITVRNNTIRFWNYNDYKHTNSLKLMSFDFNK